MAIKFCCGIVFGIVAIIYSFCLRKLVRKFILAVSVVKLVNIQIIFSHNLFITKVPKTFLTFSVIFVLSEIL